MKFDINAATGPQLVAYYNQHADQPVKKFSDLRTARRRVQQLIKEKQLETQPRGAKIKASWANPRVASARKERNGVFVRGHEFRSVSAAFKRFDLPLSKVVKFRMALKASEHGVLNFEEDERYKFVLLVAEDEPGAVAVSIGDRNVYVRSDIAARRVKEQIGS